MPTSAAANLNDRSQRAHAYENSRPEVQALVPWDARRVLDLGCSSGALGAALKQRQGAEVMGVEIDRPYADAAAARLDHVVRADIEQLLGSEAQRESLGRFDCLVAADVLEHLRDPWTALRRAAALLVPNGAAVVSLPNVRHWETLVQVVVRGTWPRRSQGLFDRDHLRWFTLRDARELLRQAGLRTTEVSPQYRWKPGDWRSARQARHLHGTRLAPFVTYQYVLCARRSSSVPNQAGED